MNFYKYQGAGNDFIILDQSESVFDLSAESIKRICDRRFGVGADGLIVFGSSEMYDFSMKFFNSDGSSGMMCGNGGRCIVSFAAVRGIKPGSPDGMYIFEGPDGIHSGKILSTDGKRSTVRLKMNDVPSVKPFYDGLFMNTGCPHLVFSCISGIETLNLAEEGPRWRYDPSFSPVGTNVDWIQVTDGSLKVRTFEKGVECETLACGTGVIASAISAYVRFGSGCPVFTSTAEGLVKCRIRTSCNDLAVEFRPTDGAPYADIWLTGEAEEVFRGTV